MSDQRVQLVRQKEGNITEYSDLERTHKHHQVHSKWMAHTGTEFTALALLAPCSNWATLIQYTAVHITWGKRKKHRRKEHSYRVVEIAGHLSTHPRNKAGTPNWLLRLSSRIHLPLSWKMAEGAHFSIWDPTLRPNLSHLNSSVNRLTLFCHFKTLRDLLSYQSDLNNNYNPSVLDT